VRAPNCGFDSMRSFGMPGTRTQNYSVKSRVVNLKKHMTRSCLPVLHFLDFKTVHETFVSHGSLEAKKKNNAPSWKLAKQFLCFEAPVSGFLILVSILRHYI